MGEFDGKVALITGASRGLGYALARALASEGAHVICVARSVAPLKTLYDEIEAAGGAATGCPLDLADFDGITRLAEQVAARWGRLDILVGNAGVLGGLSPASHIPAKEFATTFNINVAANVRLMSEFEPLLMAADAPRALFVSSHVADKARPFWGLYAASKSALNVLVQTWAAEHAADKLRIELYSPPATRTAMRAQAMPGEDPTTLPTPADVAKQMLEILRK